MIVLTINLYVNIHINIFVRWVVLANLECGFGCGYHCSDLRFSTKMFSYFYVEIPTTKVLLVQGFRFFWNENPILCTGHG